MGVKVYGSSDDLIEVEGDIRGEFNYKDGKIAFLAFSNGTVLSINYDPEGMWRINLRVAGDSSFRKTEASDPDDDYSDYAFLDGDIEWVVFGYHFVRK